MKIILLLCLLAVAYAQNYRCTTSLSRWSGYFREVTFSGEGSEFRFAHIDYDLYGQRIRVHEYERRSDGNSERVDELFLFQEKMMYRVVSGAPCEKRPLPSEAQFRPIDVPNFADFIGTDILGYGSATYGLLVDHFYLTDDRGDFSSYQNWAPYSSSQRYCVPVSLHFNGDTGPFPERPHGFFEFFNLTTLVDPDAFNVPTVCL